MLPMKLEEKKSPYMTKKKTLKFSTKNLVPKFVTDFGGLLDTASSNIAVAFIIDASVLKICRSTNF